ncbi:Uncharacterised protein [Vibrio cholerae]|nr:Uncharacterised protein [Vibrio cholerae]
MRRRISPATLSPFRCHWPQSPIRLERCAALLRAHHAAVWRAAGKCLNALTVNVLTVNA